MNETERAACMAALEALEYHTQQTRPIQRTEAAILGLREALAQPTQPQPQIAERAKFEDWAKGTRNSAIACDRGGEWEFNPEVWSAWQFRAWMPTPQPTQPQGEPVAWVNPEDMPRLPATGKGHWTSAVLLNVQRDGWTPLYTAPHPVAQPLTHEQISDMLQDHARDSKEMHDFAHAVIAEFCRVNGIGEQP